MPNPNPHVQTQESASLNHRLSLQATPTEAGKFEILAITAGVGNGWTFTPEALQASLSLWDNTECFVDHAWFSRSLRDLAGMLTSPTWDEDAQGIRLVLTPVGPSAALLVELASQLLSEDAPDPNVGFSADVYFTANGKEIETILRVQSVDLVYNPARGGAFLRALNAVNPELAKGYKMPNPDVNHTQNQTAPTPAPTPAPAPDPAPAPPAGDQLNADAAAVRSLLGEQQRMAALAQEAEEARKVRAQMCGYLLESALSAASLPPAVSNRIRSQFEDRVFEAPELQDAIDDARVMVSELLSSHSVAGPGRIHSMFNEADKLQAAVDDLFDAPRDEKHIALDVPRLSGVKELYLMLTGDRDFHGGFYPAHVLLATTADFTGLVKNALNKIVVNTWDELGRAGYDWWNRIATIEHFQTLNTITGTLVGTVGTLPAVSEGAEYTELAVGDSPETADFTKYGGYIPLTLELIDRDETRKLKAYPRELASAGLRKISALVAALFTDNSGTGPTMADTGALFNATAVTTAGGHANLLTTALAAAQWDTVATAVYNQPMLIKQATGYYGTGPKMAINPKFCVVPRNLQLTAMKILYPSLENAANIYSENMQRGQPGDVVVVPEWTDTNNWAAVCDPRLAPAIYIGERFGLMPEIYMSSAENAGAVFTNDEHRLKVRHFLAVWVNDFRPLHKSNVA